MSRLHLTFACGSLTLAGSLDTAPGHTGLLIVSGGNEIRSGAFSGQAHLAASIARAGFPVFRLDRRDDTRTGLAEYSGNVRFLLATADRTAQHFDALWDAADPRIARCAGAGHSYVESGQREWLKSQVLAALRA